MVQVDIQTQHTVLKVKLKGRKKASQDYFDLTFKKCLQNNRRLFDNKR